MPDTEFEQRARAKKALRLVDVFSALRSTPEQVEELADEGWGMAAELAKVNVPSEQTRRLVVDVLRDRLKVRTEADVFAGLPS